MKIMRLLLVSSLVSLFLMQEISSYPLDYGDELIPQIFHIGEETARDYDRDPEIYYDRPYTPPSSVEYEYDRKRWKNAFLVPRSKHAFKSEGTSAMQFVPNIISSLIASLLPPPLASLPLPPAICPV